MSWKMGLAAAIAAVMFGVAPLAHAQMQQKPPAAQAGPRPPRQAAPVSGACNINSADVAQLSLLPGVGPRAGQGDHRASAENAVSHRRRAGQGEGHRPQDVRAPAPLRDGFGSDHHRAPLGSRPGRALSDSSRGPPVSAGGPFFRKETVQ